MTDLCFGFCLTILHVELNGADLNSYLLQKR